MKKAYLSVWPIEGRDSLIASGRITHPNAGQYCAFHLIGAKGLQFSSARARTEKNRIVKEKQDEKKRAEKQGGGEYLVQRPEPGDALIEVDAERGVAPAESDKPVDVYAQDVRTVAWKPYFDHLTPKQRLHVLRAQAS